MDSAAAQVPGGNPARKQPTIRAFVPPPPPKTAKSADTRRRLLELSARLFIEQGYNAVSLRDIASAAELTKGAVYGHFRSKGQLLIEVIRWKTSEVDASTDFDEAPTDPERGVELMYQEGWREVRLLEVDAAAAARHDPDVAGGLVSFYLERHARTRDVVSELDDPDTVAWVIGALEAGIAMRESSGVKRPEASRLNAVLVATLTGLLTTDS